MYTIMKQTDNVNTVLADKLCTKWQPEYSDWLQVMKFLDRKETSSSQYKARKLTIN